MKLALMQPYLFPYIGYFQLVAAVDRFVFYDDVNYIKNGWINRNRIANHGTARYFTVPLSDASPFQAINTVRTQPPATWRRTLLESLRHQYRRAPHYAAVAALVEDVFGSDSDAIADIARGSVVRCADYIGLATDFVPTSAHYGNHELKASQRVLDICRREAADEYWNLPGGRVLYDSAEFAEHGIALHFVDPIPFSYAQGSHDFVPGLSIIDVLMHNPPSAVRAHLLHAQAVAA
ncbi:MAG TPA: WbqC family protein [Rubrivivax sp.]|nr:WbqC family protein [Rubrivivax sp.]